MDYAYSDIAKLIDHSLLNPTLVPADLEAGCRLAREYEVATVCVVPWFVPRAAELLTGSTVLTTTTVGFPHGANTTAVKVAEAREAVASGARELDMVVNISRVRAHDWAAVRADVQAVNDAAHDQGARLKVIFENCFLADEEKIRLCELCGELRVDWVKTSTGYGSGGATHDDLRLMRAHSPPHVQVKAAGGVRDLDALLAVRALGVTRVGASVTKAILDDCRRRLAPTR